MKFAIATSTFLATAVSVSAAALPSTEGADGVEARSNCNLIAHRDNNWPDLRFRRHSVAARADTGGSQNDRRVMLQKWVDIAKDVMGAEGGQKNRRCWIENDNLAHCHVTYYEGFLGHTHYKNDMQETANAWRTWSNGCDVDSSF